MKLIESVSHYSEWALMLGTKRRWYEYVPLVGSELLRRRLLRTWLKYDNRPTKLPAIPHQSH